MARFLFATVPVPAHSRNPLPVAARLVERGHEVLWFASSRFHDGIGAVGATPVPFGATRDYDGERLLEEFPDVTISKIRFLESQGLIDPERTASGYRKFYADDVDLLRCILREGPRMRPRLRRT